MNLSKIKYPEELFGDNQAEVTAKFRELAKIYHPDRGGKKEDFQRLNELHEKAQVRIAAGIYGQNDRIPEIQIKLGKNTYVFDSFLAEGDISGVYYNDKEIIKICRNPANNDLLQNEAKVLNEFKNSVTKDLKINQHVPRLINSGLIFHNKQNKAVNIFNHLSGYYTLEQVREKKGDLELADAAWMINRIIAALLLAHQNKRVHGAVLPCHFLIKPDDHNGCLIDWCYSVKEGEPIKAIVPKYKDFYPPEVFKKQPANSSTDLFMMAKVADYLVGGIDKLPKNVRGLFQACWLGPAHRSKDPYEVFEDFKKELAKIFGKPKFKVFRME